jgi:hypothetical protein
MSIFRNFSIKSEVKIKIRHDPEAPRTHQIYPAKP